MDDNKKAAAAMAAVNRYLEMEASEQAQPSDGRDMLGDRSGGMTSRMNIWGGSGRQSQMQVRLLMQLRAFRYKDGRR